MDAEQQQPVAWISSDGPSWVGGNKRREALASVLVTAARILAGLGMLCIVGALYVVLWTFYHGKGDE